MEQAGDNPTKFGEQTTGDHFLNRRKDNFAHGLGEEEDFFPGAKTAAVMYE